MILFAAITVVRRLRRRRLRSRLLGPRGRRAQARRAASRGHRPLHRPGLGGQPRLADLRLRGAVDLLPGGVRLDHPDAVRPADPRRARASCCGARASRSARRCSATRDRRNFGAAFALSSVLVPYCFGAVVGGIASGRVPSGARPVTRGTAGSTRPPSSAACWLVCLTAYLAAFFLVRDADRLSDEAMVAYFRRRATVAAVAAGVAAAVGIFVLPNDATYLFDGLTSRALPLVVLSAVCGSGRPRAARPRHPTGAPDWPPSGAVGRRRRWPGAWPSGTTCSPSR